MESHHTLASLKNVFKRTSADRPNKLVEYETTLVNDHLYSVMLLVSMLKGHPDTVKKGKERGSMQWEKWLIILARRRVIKLNQK